MNRREELRENRRKVVKRSRSRRAKGGLVLRRKSSIARLKTPIEERRSTSNIIFISGEQEAVVYLLTENQRSGRSGERAMDRESRIVVTGEKAAVVYLLTENQSGRSGERALYR